MGKREKIEVVKPGDDEIQEQIDKRGPLVNYSKDHCLNTEIALRNVKGN